jgi:hypothetical protein
MDNESELKLRDALLDNISLREVLSLCRATLTLDQKNIMITGSGYNPDGTINWGPTPRATLSECIDRVLDDNPV